MLRQLFKGTKPYEGREENVQDVNMHVTKVTDTVKLSDYPAASTSRAFCAENSINS